FFSSRRRHTRSKRDWSSDVCSSDLGRPCGSYPRRVELGRDLPIPLINMFRLHCWSILMINRPCRRMSPPISTRLLCHSIMPCCVALGFQWSFHVIRSLIPDVVPDEYWA